MKKNMIIVALVFAIPLIAFAVLNNANTTTAKTSVNVEQKTDDLIAMGKPQVIKFSSAMCLDCQTMNKLFKEVFPKYNERIVLTEVHVQDGNAFTGELIKKYNVTLVPTMIFLDSNNRQVKRIEGAIEKSELEGYLKGLK
ncbi:thioredoxin family protein [bacterium]|nr:thioredoxin family protein [bacterium]